MSSTIHDIVPTKSSPTEDDEAPQLPLRFRGQPTWKRLMDLCIATGVTIVTLPLLVLLSIVVRLGSRGPILFSQQRYGAMGEPFTIWKFRTMLVNANQGDHNTYVRQQLQSDGVLRKLNPRANLIPLGGLMRKLTVDELPQLINIFRGEMSIVGPRPDVIPLDEYEAGQLKRFEVVPGVTGLWQVGDKNNTTFGEMLALDAEYAERRSLSLDLKILFLTPWAVLRQALSRWS